MYRTSGQETVANAYSFEYIARCQTHGLTSGLVSSLKSNIPAKKEDNFCDIISRLGAFRKSKKNKLFKINLTD